MARQLGDRARARSDFEGLLRELRGQTSYEKLVADIEQRLRNL